MISLRDTTAAHFGWLCLISGLALSFIGVAAIDIGAAPTESASAASSISPLAFRQLVHLGVGLLAAAVVAAPHLRVLRYLAWPALGVCLILLVILLLPFIPSWLVTPRNGVRGWIDLGPMDLQPAELARIAFILAAAEYLRYRKNHRTLIGLLPPAIITFIPVCLIVLQPDLGAALLFIPAIFAMLVAAGARGKHMAAVVVIGALAAPVSFPFLHPYQQQRIIGLIQQFRGQRGGADDINYQAYTAQTVAGSGGLTGYSDAKARAVIRYAQLPERHNDMIFAVILCRWGFLGGMAVIGLYILWLIGAMATAAICKEAFGRLVVVGIAMMLAVQTAVNMAMVLGFLPIVGLTLPFVSYGGSSMVSVWIMTGLVFSVAMRRPPRMTRPAFEFDD